jgi:hypothetical protein
MIGRMINSRVSSHLSTDYADYAELEYFNRETSSEVLRLCRFPCGKPVAYRRSTLRIGAAPLWL